MLSIAQHPVPAAWGSHPSTQEEPGTFLSTQGCRGTVGKAVRAPQARQAGELHGAGIHSLCGGLPRGVGIAGL